MRWMPPNILFIGTHIQWALNSFGLGIFDKTNDCFNSMANRIFFKFVNNMSSQTTHSL